MSKELFWQSDSSIALQRWNADMGEAMYDDVGNVEYDIMQYTRYSYIETTCLQRSLPYWSPVLQMFVINQLEKLEAAKAAWLVCLSLLSLTGHSWSFWVLTGPYLAILGLT